MDFVPYELAVKLKEKGFDYPCITHYDINKELKVAVMEPIFWHSDVLSYTDAPTISQVLKWLREKHLLVIPIPSYFNEEGICVSWDCDIWDCDIWADDNYKCCRVDKKTYEQAAIEGIEYVLDNLI
jgi:hypothetical protein